MFIQKLFMDLLIWVLRLLDDILSLFRVLTGIDTITVNTEEWSLIDYFLQANIVQQIFWSLFIISIFIVAVSMITSIIKHFINLKGGERKPVSRTVGQGIIAIFTSIAMAGVMIVGINVTNDVLVYVNKSFNQSQATSVAGIIFEMSVGDTYVIDYKTMNTEKMLNGVGNIVKTKDGKDVLKYVEYETEELKDGTGNVVDILYIQPIINENIKNGSVNDPIYIYTEYAYIISSGWRSGNVTDGMAKINKIGLKDLNADMVYGKYKSGLIFEDKEQYITKSDGIIIPDSFNFLIGYFGAVMLLVALCMCMLGLVKRIYDLVLLFLALPLITGTIPLDDGAYFKMWRETVISKVVLAYGAVFSVNIFYIIMPMIMQIDFNSIGTGSLATIFKLFVVVGAGLSISGGQLLFARLFGTSADENREIAQSARTLFGGAATAAGLGMWAKNKVLGGTNKYGRKYGGVVGTTAKIGSGTVNAAGNLLGGNAYRGFAGSMQNYGTNKLSALKGAVSSKGQSSNAFMQKGGVIGNVSKGIQNIKDNKTTQAHKELGNFALSQQQKGVIALPVDIKNPLATDKLKRGKKK